MRRIKLWLKRSHGNPREPEFFIKYCIDIDDEYQKDNFNNRTISEDDKFEEGFFMTKEDLQKMWSAARGGISNPKNLGTEQVPYYIMIVQSDIATVDEYIEKEMGK